MWYKTASITLALLFTATVAQAHPVTFKGGTAVMTNLSLERQDLRVNYSLTPRFALGVNYSHIDLKSNDAHYTWAQANALLKRWNGEDSQTNLYAQAGLGAAFDENQTQPLVHLEGKADFETRRVYFALEHQSLISDTDLTNHMTSATAGLAPYLVNYNGFHTWIIARGAYSPQMDEDWSLSPGLRFFYHRFFAEVGSSLSGNVFLNLMTHF